MSTNAMQMKAYHQDVLIDNRHRLTFIYYEVGIDVLSMKYRPEEIRIPCMILRFCITFTYMMCVLGKSCISVNLSPENFTESTKNNHAE